MITQYKEYGDPTGPLLLFLHGGGAGGWMWDQQVTYFKEYHCLVPTLQGHGDRGDESAFSIKKSAQEMINLIEQKGKGKEVHVIGFSIGAQITVELLSLAPTLLTSAIINSALVIPMKMMRSLIAPSVKMTFPLVKNRTFSKIQAKQLYMEGEYFEKYFEDSLKINSKTMVEMLQENMAYTLPKNFAESTSRILVTVGEKERRIMRKSAVKITESHSNCTHVVVPNIGHGFFLVQPELFNQLLGAWLVEELLPII